MRVQTLLNKTLRLPGLWVRDIQINADRLRIYVRRRFRNLTCPHCKTRVFARYDQRQRSWQHLALWGLRVEIVGTIRRLFCTTCRAVVTEDVPWARHGSDFTRPFEDAVAFLARDANKTFVHRLFGISWKTVGNIASRLVSEVLDHDRFLNLRRIGVDEISYRRHHKYITVVIDHDTGNVIWAAEGKSSQTLGKFFDLLSTETLRGIELITMDLSAAYQKAVRERLGNVDLAFDKFHLVQLANKALQEVRRFIARQLSKGQRRSLKDARWALLKNPENLSTDDCLTLEDIRKSHRAVYRAWLLKETFADILDLGCPNTARRQLLQWLAWAARSRLHAFIRLGRTVRHHLEGILKAIESGLTNARLEGMNNKIRLLSHRAYGFHSAEALIGMVYLCCTKIPLPDPHLL